MTRKDYAMIAKDIADAVAMHPTKEAHNALFGCACLLANSLKAENPRFDRDKFLQACGFTKG